MAATCLAIDSCACSVKYTGSFSDIFFISSNSIPSGR